VACREKWNWGDEGKIKGGNCDQKKLRMTELKGKWKVKG
jgi:hypothetical protein